MKRRALLPALLLCLITPMLRAQARFAIYGTAGTEKSGLPDQGWKLGGTFGFYYGLLHAGPFDVSVDARGDLSKDINSGFLGPRVAFKLPVFPVKPYGEFIMGVSTYPRTNAGIQHADNFAYRYVVGLDSTIFPHFDWRVVDFAYGINRSAGFDHAKAITSGFVIRF